MRVGFTVIAIGVVILSVGARGLSPYWWIALFSLVTGIGMGMAVPATNNASLQLARTMSARSRVCGGCSARWRDRLRFDRRCDPCPQRAPRIAQATCSGSRRASSSRSSPQSASSRSIAGRGEPPRVVADRRVGKDAPLSKPSSVHELPSGSPTTLTGSLACARGSLGGDRVLHRHREDVPLHRRRGGDRGGDHTS